MHYFINTNLFKVTIHAVSIVWIVMLTCESNFSLFFDCAVNHDHPISEIHLNNCCSFSISSIDILKLNWNWIGIEIESQWNYIYVYIYIYNIY